MGLYPKSLEAMVAAEVGGPFSNVVVLDPVNGVDTYSGNSLEKPVKTLAAAWACSIRWVHWCCRYIDQYLQRGTCTCYRIRYFRESCGIKIQLERGEKSPLSQDGDL
jgi:hypothetical protein